MKWWTEWLKSCLFCSLEGKIKLKFTVSSVVWQSLNPQVSSFSCNAEPFTTAPEPAKTMLRIFAELTVWHRPPQPGLISAGAGDQRASRSRLLLSLASHPASKGRAVPRQRKQAAHRPCGSHFCTPVPLWGWHLGYWNKRKSQQHNSLSRWETNPCASEARFGLSGNHSLWIMVQQQVSGFLSLQHNTANNPSSLSCPICSLATNSIFVHCLLHHTLFPIFVAFPLSLSIFPCENNPYLLPYSTCLCHLSFGWSVCMGGNSMYDVSTSTPNSIITVYFHCNNEQPLWTLKHHPEMLNAVISIKGHQSPVECSLPKERSSFLQGGEVSHMCYRHGAASWTSPSWWLSTFVLAMPPSLCFYFWCQHKVVRGGCLCSSSIPTSGGFIFFFNIG